jgi:hypothetical protein
MGMFPGLGCPARPSFPRPGGAETVTQAQETLAPGDPLGQEARHAYREQL